MDHDPRFGRHCPGEPGTLSLKKKNDLISNYHVQLHFSIPLKSKYYNKISDCMTNVIQNVSIHTIIIKFLFSNSPLKVQYIPLFGVNRSFLKDAQYLGKNNYV